MSEYRELRRFRPGEACEECPARRWYAESGFRYCENGHRVEVRDPATIGGVPEGLLAV